MAKTVEEISRETGFSVTTVRLVINGQSERYRISAATRKKIKDYVALHGYSINHAARSLKLNRSDTVGFVVPDLSNAFFARLMAALEGLCRKRDLLLLTVASHEDPVLENRAVAKLLARGVDGLVIAPCQPQIAPQLLKSRKRTPVVMFDRDYGTGKFPTVVSNNSQGALEMTRRMLQETGGEPFPFLCGHAESPSIQDRIRGFNAACAEQGVAGEGRVLLEAEDSVDAGRRLMLSLIEGGRPLPRAFMCSSLLVLEGALQQIRANCGRIPPEILIGTFDDHAMLDLLPNPVLSIRQDENELSRRIVDYLAGALAGEDPAGVLSEVPAELVCRNLAASVAAVVSPANST